MKAILRQIRISPKKANLVAALVRNKKVGNALDILRFTPKKAAPILRKVISSAISNAETNFKQTKDNLYIKEIVVTEGPTYKRSLPASRGRVAPILKRTSHITVKLAVNTGAKQATKEAAKEPEKEEKVEKKSTPKTTVTVKKVSKK